MYLKRELEEIVVRTSNAFPVVLITGPRQVGKTTMLQQLAGESRKYVSLDNLMQRELAIHDPELFIQKYAPPVMIDEIQYAPQLLPYIKIYADKHKKNGDFWLTGSQMFHMMKNVSESLAGRVGIINMLGLSNHELHGMPKRPYSTEFKPLLANLQSAKKMDLHQTFARIFKGSMPALYGQEQDLEMFLSSYLNTYIQRDIKDLTQVGDELAFMRFMTSCAARTSQMLNYSDMAKDVGISVPTAKQWLSILISSGIVTLIEPYFNNVLKRTIKSPNMYFLDTGLCAYLTRYSSSETLEASAMSGAIFETYVVSEIIKSFINAGKRPPLFYYRDIDRKKIDLIIEQNNILYPIEIKKSANPNRDFVKHFSVLEKIGKQIGTGNVICLCSDLLPIDKNNYFVPAWLI